MARLQKQLTKHFLSRNSTRFLKTKLEVELPRDSASLLLGASPRVKSKVPERFCTPSGITQQSLEGEASPVSTTGEWTNDVVCPHGAMSRSLEKEGDCVICSDVGESPGHGPE